MNLQTLRRRAAGKRARIEATSTHFRVLDTGNDELIGEVARDSDYLGGLLALEDKIAWLDAA